jgi:TolB-like protein/DNA-binding winged helix-turn-helix (wHTH) protein/Tfp pilus assembly protein PilF
LELDADAYELRREGRVVRLERIPMDTLLFLVDRRPGLVTREEIVEKVWGKGVFLDTDNSLNVAIRKIRQALRDDPDEPRFIRTVPGKGYRFIAVPREGPLQGTVPEPAGPPAADPNLPDGPSPPPAGPSATRHASLGRIGWSFLALLIVAGAGVEAYVRHSNASPPPAAKERPMLAVLPFDNLTGDAGQDFFCEGFTEEMITRLGSLDPKWLGVIARSSAMSYRRGTAPLERLGRELGVQYVLEGSIRRDVRDAGRIRITAQLVQVKDQTQLWAREFDRDDTDVLRIQEEIARAIADQILPFLGEPRLAPGQTIALSKGGYEAYEEYLRGRYFWNLRTEEGFRRAVESFKKALAANPDDARSLAGLAETYTLLGTYTLLPEQEVFPKARATALRALEIDERLAGPHAALALINEMYDMDWPTAESRFRKAVELDPNDATAHQWYAEFLGFQGRFDEALSEIALARRLDPRSLIMTVDHGYILALARQSDRAVELFREALTVDPTFGRAVGGLIGTYIDQGRYAEALAETRRWEGIDAGMFPWAAEAHIRGRLGQMDKAEEALRHLEEAARRSHTESQGPRTFAYLGMRRRDDVFAQLEETCRAHPWRLAAQGLRVSPAYDWLRDDPRFQELLRCARLAP